MKEHDKLSGIFGKLYLRNISHGEGKIPFRSPVKKWHTR